MTAILLGVAYLGLALGGESPVVMCAAALEPCPVDPVKGIASCAAQEGRECCSHGKNEDSRPACCVTIPEEGHEWVLPLSVKIPDMAESAELPLMAPMPIEIVRSLDRAIRCNSPDPPGPAGRSLLIRVSRQLV